MNFFNIFFNLIKFFGNIFVFFFNFLVLFKDILISLFLILVRFIFFIFFIVFEFSSKIFFFLYKIIVLQILYFYNYVLLRIKSLKLIIVKFDNYRIKNLISKFSLFVLKFNLYFFSYKLGKNIYNLFFSFMFFIYSFVIFFKNFFLKYFYLIFSNLIFLTNFFFKKLVETFFFIYIFLKRIINYVFTLIFKIKNLFYFIYIRFFSFLKLKIPYLYNFFLYSRFGYLLAVFYLYAILLFPFLQDYENFLFNLQFSNFFEDRSWYGNLIDVGGTNAKGWLSGSFDASDFFLIKILISFCYFLLFVPYFRNVWFKEEDWETTFTDSEFDNDEIMEEEDDFDDPYVEADNLIQQGEEVSEYYDELRGKSLVKARVNNFTRANGYIISNDYGWGFFIIFWVFTFYYSIKMFFWPNFLFLPYISLLNLHAKSTMYAALIPYMENYIHSNLFVYNNWVPGSPLKHVWYNKPYNNINISEGPEELIWNRPKNYSWMLWNDLYLNYSDKYYFKRKPRYPGHPEQRRARLYNAPTNLGFLDYYDNIFQEDAKSKRKHITRFELKKMYSSIDSWNEIYKTYPLANKNLNLWKRSVLNFRGQINSYYNNGYNFLNYWPKKEKIAGMFFGLDTNLLSNKSYTNGFFFNSYKNIYDSSLTYNTTDFGLNLLYTNFIHKRDTLQMPVTYNLADSFRRLKTAYSFLLYPHYTVPFYTTIANITILPYFRRSALPMSYDYGLDSLSLDQQLPFWLFLNKSVIYDKKSSFIFFDLMNYLEKHYYNYFHRQILLKMWYEYNEGFLNVSQLIKKQVYPLFFYDMQHSPFNFKYSLEYQKSPYGIQEEMLVENQDEIKYYNKTRFFNYIDPKWLTSYYINRTYVNKMKSLEVLGKDMDPKLVAKGKEYGLEVVPEWTYQLGEHLTFSFYVSAILWDIVAVQWQDMPTLYSELYPFDFLKYSYNFNLDTLINNRTYNFSRSSHFSKNFFTGFNVELSTSKQSSFLNYYNKYFVRKEGGISNIFSQLSFTNNIRTRKDISLYSMFDFFFNMKTYDLVYLSNTGSGLSVENDLEVSDMEIYDFSDITRGFRQLPYLFFTSETLLYLNENEKDSLSSHGLAKENFINEHFIYLKYLNYNQGKNFAENFSYMLKNSDLFLYWYTDYIHYALNSFEDSLLNLPYQFYLDSDLGLLDKKVDVLILDKFTLFQAPYSNIFFFIKGYTFLLNFLVYLFDFMQQLINKVYTLEVGVTKKGIVNFLSFLPFNLDKLNEYSFGYYYLYNDSYYGISPKYHILDDFQPYSADFSHEISLKEVVSDDLAVPYALKSLNTELNQEVLNFFLNDRIFIFEHTGIFSAKNLFNKDYVSKFYMLYDNELILKNLNLKNRLLLSLNELSVRTSIQDDEKLLLFLELSSKNNNNLEDPVFLATLSLYNNFWLGDSFTYYLLNYDFNFLNFKYKDSLVDLFVYKNKNIIS